MSTFADLIEEVESYLYSFGQTRDKVTALVGSLNTSATSFIVDDAKQVDRGYIEIDQEMMAVKTSDPSTGTITLHAWGRGQRGTTGASHTSGTKVSNAPRFPRSRIGLEINNVVNTLYPNLFAVAQDETQTVSPATVTYPLPATAESIISVQFQSTGASKMWVPVTRYKMDYNADLTAFPTGKTLDIYGAMQPGRTLKIRFRRKFGNFVAESDTFASVNLDEVYRDIIRLYTVGRLLMGLDSARLEVSAIESASNQTTTQPTQAMAVGRQYLLQAQQRIAEERRRLLTQYPSTQVRMS